MTRLTIYEAKNPDSILLDTADADVIGRELEALGAGFARWEAAHPVADDATQDEILVAYADEINRLKSERGYSNADVVSIRPGNPNWPTLRAKFQAEHIHDEDEVRFFVAGSGAFYLHIGERVYQVVGKAGDLLFVPQGTPHWFDGGPEGNFTCIRLFTDQAGWIARYTGDAIADALPSYEPVAA
jgi:1,2-dihydroxy-3-keto-5-methylthiopentene dioxygenase